MSLPERVLGFCACVLLASAIGAPALNAAPAEATPSDPSKTIFVDLSAAGGAQAAPQATAPVPVPSTIFVDLSRNSAPTTVPPPQSASPIRTPRTRHIDLSNGAALPAMTDEDAYLPEPVPDRITITADRIADPYEDANRGRFKSHVGLHRYVIDPVERSYIYVVPVPARDGIHNFLTNLETPTVLANNLLKGEWDRAGNTLSRFVVNTTIGIGGLFDFAGDAGIAYRDDDFGQTLAHYGVSDSPYLLIPVIGPSNPRDLGGKVVDFVMDPLHFVTLPGGIITSIGHTGLHEVDKRSVDVGELDQLAKTSPDAYADERAKARAERNAEITGMPLSPSAEFGR